MGKVFFGFAISDSMFPAEPQEDGWFIYRRTIGLDEVMRWFARGQENNSFVCCCNPSHKATIAAMTARFGLEVSIPEKPPVVSLNPGDTLIVMSVRGLPRLTDRHEYTFEEINKATFSFGQWSVDGPAR